MPAPSAAGGPVPQERHRAGAAGVGPAPAESPSRGRPMSGLGRLAERCRRLQQVLRDPLRKPLSQIVREAADVARRSRAHPDWYFLSFAYRKDTGPYREYLVRGQYKRLEGLREGEHHEVLEDKLRFHDRFRDTDCRIPRLLAHNCGSVFHVGATVRHIGDGRSFAALVDELCGRSTTGSIFVKPVDGMQGSRCHRINSASGDLGWIHADTVARRFLFEETLVQHEALGAVFPSSVNTIRVVTCAGLGEPPVVVAALLRLGAEGRVVDNASQGGVFVGVELETGRLLPSAHRFFKYGGGVYATHPDTGFRFAGFEVPFFPEVLMAAKNAAAHVPHELVGWDIAVTEAGPVIIEGNTVPSLPIMEIALGRGLMAHPSIRKLCERLDAVG